MNNNLETMLEKRNNCLKQIDWSKDCSICTYEFLLSTEEPCKTCYCELIGLPIEPCNWLSKEVKDENEI